MEPAESIWRPLGELLRREEAADGGRARARPHGAGRDRPAAGRDPGRARLCLRAGAGRRPGRAVRRRAPHRARLRHRPLGRDRPASPRRAGARGQRRQARGRARAASSRSSATPSPDPELDRLEAENRRLQDEIERLRGEFTKLKLVETPVPASSHLLFVPTPARYLLVEREGAPPRAGREARARARRLRRGQARRRAVPGRGSPVRVPPAAGLGAVARRGLLDHDHVLRDPEVLVELRGRQVVHRLLLARGDPAR